MARWHNDKMAQGQDGTMAQLYDGTMARLKLFFFPFSNSFF
jgi:hypothetical protein